MKFVSVSRGNGTPDPYPCDKFTGPRPDRLRGIPLPQPFPPREGRIITHSEESNVLARPHDRRGPPTMALHTECGAHQAQAPLRGVLDLLTARRRPQQQRHRGAVPPTASFIRKGTAASAARPQTAPSDIAASRGPLDRRDPHRNVPRRDIRKIQCPLARGRRVQCVRGLCAIVNNRGDAGVQIWDGAKVFAVRCNSYVLRVFLSDI